MRELNRRRKVPCSLPRLPSIKPPWEYAYDMFASIGTTYELDRHTNEGRRGSQTHRKISNNRITYYVL